MTLVEFLGVSGQGAIARLARAAGVNLATAYRWKSGRCVPKPSHMAAIRKWSNGAVTPGDFYDLPTPTRNG